MALGGASVAVERLEVDFSGRVQGVGFRHTTTILARDFAVTGYVQNLPDGRVRLVAEGASEELDGLLRAIERRMAGFIREAKAHRGPANGEFDAFGVRY